MSVLSWWQEEVRAGLAGEGSSLSGVSVCCDWETQHMGEEGTAQECGKGAGGEEGTAQECGEGADGKGKWGNRGVVVCDAELQTTSVLSNVHLKMTLEAVKIMPLVIK